MKLLSGFLLSNGARLYITKAIGWSSFDVKLETSDWVKQARLTRLALTLILQRFKETGLLQVQNAELSVPTMAERIQVLEQAEAVMRQEI